MEQNTASSESWSLPVLVDGKHGILRYDATTFSVIPLSPKGTLQAKPSLSTSLRNVLWAESTTSNPSSTTAGTATAKSCNIKISTLAIKSRQHVLVQISARCDQTEALGNGEGEAKVKEWVARLMEMAYEGVSPQRKFKVLVNPMGGKGQAKKIYETRVKPILDAARSIYDTQHTTHRFHAEEIAAALPLDTNPIDAILALSGDGLPHEIINGLASRKDAKLALRTPVVPVPTGSANGFNINLQGVKHTFDVGLAVLNAIKGKPLELDLLSVVQNGKRRWSFYSQAFGLMADIDLGTENIRWMGDTRFVMGYIRGIFNRKPSPIDLFVKVAKSDKEELVKDLIEHSSASGKPASQALPTETNTPGADVLDDTSLPQDQFINEDTTSGDWIQFDKPMIYVYGGMMPYVAADLMQFPMATPAQGVVDLVVQEMVSRGTMVSAMDGAEHGKQFWMPSQVYYKAKAFKVTPKAGSKGFISIDGEAFPWGEIYVEVHKGLMHTLTLNGDRFVSTFDPHGGPQGKNKGKTVAK